MTAITMKRSLALLMALLMTLGVLLTAVSCGETTEQPGDQTNAQAGIGTTEAETEERKAYATVEKENFDRAFTILTREDTLEEFYVEEYTGDLLDDLIYERNTVVSTDFGVEFVYYDMAYDQVMNEMKTQVTSGLDDYDLYTGHKYAFTSCAQNNYCYNLGLISSIDLTGEWWDQNCYANLTIDDK